MKILVLSDKLANYRELCGGVKALGGEAVACAVCGKDEAAGIPAEKVYYVEADDCMLYEDCVKSVEGVIAKESPAAIFISATKRGKYMAAVLAAHLGTSALTDISNITCEGGVISGTQMYYGGAAVRTIKSKNTAVVTVGAGSFEPVEGCATEVVAATPCEAGKIIKKEIRKKEVLSVNLGAARKVVGVGRGFSKKEDISLAEALAAAAGCEVGCSRPIAEGEKWMDVARYIGVSGVILKPDVYFAVGISGQIQHTIGIAGAKTIIAINKDKNAPIFKVCDYGIVGDLYKILPELTDMINAG